MCDPVAIGSAAADPPSSTSNQLFADPAREPQGLSPSGGNSAAKPHVFLRPCAPMARSPGCRGAPPAERRLFPARHHSTHQTRKPRGLSPSGGNSAAKPLSLECPRALWARCGVQGHCPCLAAGAVDFDDVAALAKLLEHPVDLLQTLDLYHHGDDAGLFLLVPLGRDRHNGNVHVSDAHGQLAQ